MKKSDLLMGIMTAIFFIMCGIYIKTDMDKYKIRPCTYEVPDKERSYSSKETIYSNNPMITIGEYETLPYTTEEEALLARVIMSEGSILPYHGKLAIMATIMNRVRSDKFPDTIEEVIYQENQFSISDNGDPTQECYNAIYDYVETGWPNDMYYFSSGSPHSFGYEYLHIGNTYFNTEKNFY